MKESREKINPLALMLPALNLDALLNQKLSSGGHYVPELSSYFYIFVDAKQRFLITCELNLWNP
ncbi:MAG: hypothetical protein HY265_07220 [Deltaproteobacteria bacterium]|nr:hypothetical protein [Deltaproteobacteria bacterium]